MRTLLFTLASLCAFFASADVFKCVAPAGNTVYQSSPCVAAANKVGINTKTGVTTDLNALETKQQAEQKNQEEKMAKEKAEKQQMEQKQAQLKQDALNEIEKNKQLIRNNPQQFSAYAIPPYLPDALPPLVKNFKERLPEIERFRRQAAEKALASGQCGRVEADELNVKSTKTALVFLVDCGTGKSFYYAEQDLGQ